MNDDIQRLPASELNRTVNYAYMFLFGVPEAFIISQIQFWLTKSNNKRDGKTWVFKTFEEWHKELPYWTTRTIKKAFKKLEDNQVVISTDKYNKMRIDRTKWYRINYEHLDELCHTQKVQDLVEQLTAPERNYKNYMTVEQREKMENKNNASDNLSDNSSNNSSDHSNRSSECSNRNDVSKDARKERSMSKKQTEKSKEVTEVIEYLNTKTGARYKPSSHANRTLIIARMNEGYTVQDLKTVIDNQVSAWRGTEWEKYLRPSTLFRASKIENYLNSKRLNHSQRYNSTVQDQYDNLQYTDLSKEDLSGGPF